jgi:hypothetical protein
LKGGKISDRRQRRWFKEGRGSETGFSKNLKGGRNEKKTTKKIFYFSDRVNDQPGYAVVSHRVVQSVVVYGKAENMGVPFSTIHETELTYSADGRSFLYE